MLGIKMEQYKARQAPDGFIQKTGMHRQRGINRHPNRGKLRFGGKQLGIGALAEHPPRHRGVDAKGLLIHKVAPAAHRLTKQKTDTGKVEHGEYFYFFYPTHQAAEKKCPDHPAVDGKPTGTQIEYFERVVSKL